MDITPHFSYEEFSRPLRTRYGKVFPAAEYPREWIHDRLEKLCGVLEIVRAALGNRVIHVGSGYRDRAYNVAIGGARFSQHMEGRAADIVVKGVSPDEVHKAVLDLYITKRIVIGGLGRYPTFTHVDIRPAPRLSRWNGSRPMAEGEDSVVA